MKVKCECSRDEKPEWKWKWAWVKEVEAEQNSSKRSKKMSEEGSNKMMELVEVLWIGLKDIMDALSKQRRLL